MKLENQVASLALSQKLKELGVEFESYFVWWVPPTGAMVRKRKRGDSKYHNVFAAPTVAELGAMLPKGVQHRSYAEGWESFYPGMGSHMGTTEADCRALMLIHILEDKLISIDEVNRRRSEQI